jgi:hypothetical protein
MSDPDLVVVSTFRSRAQADLAKSALEAGGIETMVLADDAGGIQPGLWEGRGVTVVVRREDAQAAREILEIAARPQGDE